jgi:tetratricopeptide (TPR) repeat protein
MSHSGSHPTEADYSKVENDKPTPTILSMSPEYPKYRDAVIIGGVILLLAVFVGGLYLLARHKDWSVRKLVGRDWSRLYADFYNNRGLTYFKKGQYEKAISAFTKAIEINPLDAEGYNNLAWILATCPDARYRDGTEAAELAQKSVDLVLHSQNLDTLAAAYAEVGKFEHAITTQEKAIAQLKKEGAAKKLIDEFIEHLKSYRKHKPWREKPKTMKE